MNKKHIKKVYNKKYSMFQYLKLNCSTEKVPIFEDCGSYVGVLKVALEKKKC